MDDRGIDRSRPGAAAWKSLRPPWGWAGCSALFRPDSPALPAGGFPSGAGIGCLLAALSADGFLPAGAGAAFALAVWSGGFFCGFSCLGGALGSFAASEFFSGSGCLLGVAVLSGIVNLLHRKMGTKKASRIGTQKTTRSVTCLGLHGRRRDSTNRSSLALGTVRQADMRGCSEWACWFSACSPAHR